MVMAQSRICCSAITPQREWKGHHPSFCFVMTQGCDYLMITTLPVMPYCLYIPCIIMNPEALSRFHSKSNDWNKEVACFSRYTLVNVFIKGNYQWPLLSDIKVTDIWGILALCFQPFLPWLPVKKKNPFSVIFMTGKLFCLEYDGLSCSKIIWT